jgi:lipoprotein-anchoring transpeptidase ErfK/SrfK
LHTDDDKMLKVDLASQTLEAYEGETLIRIMPVSTGVSPQWTTPQGHFWIYRRVKDDHMQGGVPGSKDSWDVQHVPYAQYIYQGIALHGAWWNRHFGIPKSHGCIQLSTRTHSQIPGETVDNARWVWNFADIGTPVTVTGRTPRDVSEPLAYPQTRPAQRSHAVWAAHSPRSD